MEGRHGPDGSRRRRAAQRLRGRVVSESEGGLGWCCGNGQVGHLAVTALNESTDLIYFERSNPCGMSADIMTPMGVLTGRVVTMMEAHVALIGTWPGALTGAVQRT